MTKIAPNIVPEIAPEIVQADSLITLHYRVAAEDGEEWLSTFGFAPAVIQLGSGELAPPFEACLIGQPVGAQCAVTLTAEQAFGPRQPVLLRRVKRDSLPANVDLAVNARAEIAGPDGRLLSGIVRELDADSALIDFNHPLAGKAIRFEAEIVGVL